MNSDAAIDLSGMQTGSPLISLIALALAIFGGAGLLMLVVRWSEGFAITYWSALKLTVLTVVVGIIAQVAVFVVLPHLGYTGMSAYWGALGVLTLISIVICTSIYAYWVKRPDGAPIGLSRAVKVTLIQLAISLALLVALAVLVTLLFFDEIMALQPQMR